MLVCHTEVELVKHLLKMNGDGNMIMLGPCWLHQFNVNRVYPYGKWSWCSCLMVIIVCSSGCYGDRVVLDIVMGIFYFLANSYHTFIIAYYLCCLILKYRRNECMSYLTI